jgi:hypothetical protein
VASFVFPELEPGRVYRTRDFERWSANPPRYAKQLVEKGLILPLAHGLFVSPRHSKFGPVPPDDEALMQAYLGGSPFVFTGPERWNALSLGSTAVFSVPLVYNTKRTGLVELGARTFELRRIAFPFPAPREWFVVDLFANADRAGASRTHLAMALTRALKRDAFDRERLAEQARRYGKKNTRDLIQSALQASTT